MQGTRIFNFKIGHTFLNKGEYAKDERDGIWYFKAPNADGIGSLANHTVIENKNKTITVTPSIISTDGNNQWHGYLTNGIWKEC